MYAVCIGVMWVYSKNALMWSQMVEESALVSEVSSFQRLKNHVYSLLAKYKEEKGMCPVRRGFPQLRGVF